MPQLGQGESGCPNRLSNVETMRPSDTLGNSSMIISSVFSSRQKISLHSSDSTLEEVHQILKGELQVTPRDQITAKAQALVRDNYCCLITGLCDSNTCENYPEVAARVDSLGILATPTNAAYIFPASTNKGNACADGGNSKTKYATSIWTVMNCFAGIKLTNELNGLNIHRLENVMTLDTGVHELFDSLDIWLEETDMPHMYRVGGKSRYTLRFSPTVTFSTTTGLPLPDSRYLRVHARKPRGKPTPYKRHSQAAQKTKDIPASSAKADKIITRKNLTLSDWLIVFAYIDTHPNQSQAACAKVANMSGAGEFVDRFLKDMENTCVLAASGSSADLLRHALRFRETTL